MSRRRSTFQRPSLFWRFGYRLVDLRLGFLQVLNVAEQERDEVAS